MGRRLVVVMLIAALIAGGVFYFTRLVQQSSQQPVPVATAQDPAPAATSANSIMVAAKDLPAGTLIQANMLVFRPWPAAGIDNTSHIVEGKASLSDFDGAVVRSGVRAGEPVVGTNLIKRGESGFLAAVLKPGMRAITVAVNENTGVAGFVFPGDVVDLVLSHTVNLTAANGQPRPHQISETVMQNLRVIAVDQRVGDQDQVPAVARGVTIEATPEQAERVALLQRMGELRLLLRPLTKTEDEAVATPDGAPTATATEATDTRTFTIDSDVSQIIAPPGGSEAGASTGGSVQLVRGRDKTTEQPK
jgi:pilus assembly protein CpaB